MTWIETGMKNKKRETELQYLPDEKGENGNRDDDKCTQPFQNTKRRTRTQQTQD